MNGTIALLQRRLQNDVAQTSLNAMEEGATMVQVASLFNQRLHHFPRLEFAALVKKHKAERAAKGFDCWTQFVAMLFCQLGHADSLREICNGLSCCLGKLVHLGIAKAPNRSTLSYANQHRPAALYQELFYTALERFRAATTGRSQAHFPLQEQAALAPRAGTFIEITPGFNAHAARLPQTEWSSHAPPGVPASA